MEGNSKKLVKVEAIAIKCLKNRWGIMTNEGSINLNVNLLKALGRVAWDMSFENKGAVEVELQDKIYHTY